MGLNATGTSFGYEGFSGSMLLRQSPVLGITDALLHPPDVSHVFTSSPSHYVYLYSFILIATALLNALVYCSMRLKFMSCYSGKKKFMTKMSSEQPLVQIHPALSRDLSHL